MIIIIVCVRHSCSATYTHKQHVSVPFLQPFPTVRREKDMLLWHRGFLGAVAMRQLGIYLQAVSEINTDKVKIWQEFESLQSKGNPLHGFVILEQGQKGKNISLMGCFWRLTEFGRHPKPIISVRCPNLIDKFIGLLHLILQHTRGTVCHDTLPVSLVFLWWKWATRCCSLFVFVFCHVNNFRLFKV